MNAQFDQSTPSNKLLVFDLTKSVIENDKSYELQKQRYSSDLKFEKRMEKERERDLSPNLNPLFHASDPTLPNEIFAQ